MNSPQSLLFPFLKPYWKLAILAPICVALEAVLEMQLPLLLATIVDNGILQGEASLIWYNISLMFGFLFLALIMGMIAAYASGIVSYGFSMDLRIVVYKHIMSLSVAKVESFSSASIITRLTNDIGVMQEFVATLLRLFIRAPFLLFGGIVMMFILNVKFALILLCTLPFQVLIIIWVMKKSNPLYEKIQKYLDLLSRVTQENVTGTRTIKSYAHEEYEQKRFDEVNDDLSQSMYKVKTILGILWPVMIFIMHIGLIILIIVGAFGIQAGEMQIGQIMAGITYLMQILYGTIMVSFVFPIYARANASTKRLKELLDLEIEKSSVATDCKALPKNSKNQDMPKNQENLEAQENQKVLEENNSFREIEFKNVCFHYPYRSKEKMGKKTEHDEFLTLEDISFTIKRGETIGILGATGSGKTSLMNLLFRYYEASSGEILINGKNIKEYSLDTLRSSIGIVSQKSELFTGTVWDNLLWGDVLATKEQMIEAAKLAQADEYISCFAKGYDTLLGIKGITLSGGQRQRLCIARALLKKPSLFIMDDCTSALDLRTENIVYKAIMQNKEGMTRIIIAQRIASLQHADKILVLDKGRICACGNHEKLLQESTIYKEIYSIQSSDWA